MNLTPDDVERIDKALSAAIESPEDFTDFQVDFALSNASRLGTYGVRTHWSEKQWAVIAGIEEKMEESDG